MTTASANRIAGLFLILCGFLSLGENVYGHDFGRIVRLIAAEYHVHRNYRFLMAFAGLVAKVHARGWRKSFQGGHS